MPFVSGFSKNEAQLLLTLSNLAYEDVTPLPGESVDDQANRMRKHISAALAAPPSYADWTVAWGPALNDYRSNMMYVAESPSANQCAVAIRGTNWAYIEDWLQDLGVVLGLTSFPYVIPAAIGAVGNVQIAEGTWLGLKTLTTMEGEDATGQKSGVATFLKGKLEAGADVFVTGHSLGGCLASVVAPWLASLQGTADHFKVYTFAAPSAGNGDFATYYNNLFVDATGQSTAYRVYNSLDAVPNAWASLTNISTYYQPAPVCTPELKVLLAAAELRVANSYVQVGDAQQSAVKLVGSVVMPTTSMLLSLIDDEAFLNQIDLQHGPSTYMRLLSA